jgi:hypothetical protein
MPVKTVGGIGNILEGWGREVQLVSTNNDRKLRQDLFLTNVPGVQNNDPHRLAVGFEPVCNRIPIANGKPRHWQDYKTPIPLSDFQFRRL